ncbi:MAG: hypothetical protein GY799_11655 [Desulfobulbaceae bacterium]|nr:hypothetical protein [Desulfobulbaceae bacterium]
MATSEISLDQLTAELRGTYLADEANAVTNLEARLDETFIDCSAAERSDFLKKLIAVFNQSSVGDSVVSGASSDEYNRLLTMLLGKEILTKKLPPEEMIQQVAAAVNTVFDSVNTLVGGMNSTLIGSGSPESEETVRMVIRSSMDAGEGIGALKKFLDQTGEFFAIALKAYKEAARVKIDEILDELNPERLEAEFEGKVKFGPLYKAQLYDCYLGKYKTLQNWQRSGLLLEAFMKEFEKNCQILYSRMNLE